MTNLTALCVWENKGFTKISHELFSNLINLDCINFKGCAIAEIEPGAFDCLTKLRRLNLSGNQLKKCPRIGELKNLQALDLDRNQIKSVEGVFSEPGLAVNTKLIMLNLKSNRLKSLPANSFSSLVALRALDLAKNDLEQVSDEALGGLVNLRELDLSFTKLTVISKNFTAPLARLERLHLVQTKLKSIEFEAFYKFRNIVKLFLESKSLNTKLLRPRDRVRVLFARVTKK